jgi:multidrug efflux pump
MDEVWSPVIATVLVMASIFVPAAFLPGTTGQLYKQFAITIAISVAISGFVALTLTPSLCGVLLRHKPPPRRGPFAWFNRQFDALTLGFGRIVVLVIRRMAFAFIFLAGFVALIFYFFGSLPTSFVPNEDQGYVMTTVLLPDAASLDRAIAVTEKVDEIYAAIPGVQDRTFVGGYSILDGGSKTNAGSLFVTLKPYDERYETIAKAKDENAGAVLRKLYAKGREIPEGLVIPIAPPAIPGIGTTGGFEFWVQDTAGGDPTRLDDLTQQVLGRARQRPELAGLNTTFRANTVQLRAEVDREKATLLAVPVSDVYSAIQAQFGSLMASQYNEFSRVWWVVLQSDPKYRQNPDDLTRLYTRSNAGDMVPLSALVKTSWVRGPDLLPHFNGMPAARINGQAAPGYSSGQAIQAMEEVARDVLPAGYAFAWSGLAYEEKQSGGTSAAAFLFGLIIVFLVLAAQYESWTLPGAVMTAVPFGILGALLLNWLRGLENDVYFQIGLLVLIGLGAKNALLRVTFAVDLRKQGRSLMDATIEAGEMRLRPIIMTSLAFVLGVLPLAVATGVGANSRHSIGTGIIGGMLGETTLAMLYVPLFFYIFESLSERLRDRKKKRAAPVKADHPPLPAPEGGV